MYIYIYIYMINDKQSLKQRSRRGVCIEAH